MNTMYLQIAAIIFAVFALAEFWSKTAESRKRGYCAAAIFLAAGVIFAVAANLGSIIYGTK